MPGRQARDPFLARRAAPASYCTYCTVTIPVGLVPVVIYVYVSLSLSLSIRVERAQGVASTGTIVFGVVYPCYGTGVRNVLYSTERESSTVHSLVVQLYEFSFLETPGI